MFIPGKFAPGLKGFPAPAAAADVSAYLLFLFPDPLWAQYVLGACEPLQYPYNWYDAGGISPDDAAEAFRVIVEQAPYNLVPPTAEAPFWDADSDVGAEEPADAQAWYGVVEDVLAPPGGITFSENLQVWTFAGLLAIAGAPGAAISFVTIAPKFIIAIKGRDVGEIIRIIVDAQDVASIDTAGHAGEVIETTVVGDPANMTHQIYLIKAT